MRYVLHVSILACLVTVPLAAAETVSTDDVIKMARQGIGEEVLIAAVERSDSAYLLTADQILKLKDNGVSDRVIAAMLRKKGTPMLPPVEVAPRTPDAATQPEAPAMAQGTLNIENVDDLPWAYTLDPNARVLWISKPDASSQRLLAGHGGVSLSAAAGAYEIRYVDSETGHPMSVVAGQSSLVLVSRVDTQDFEGLYVSVFEQGERKGGGRLAILRQTPRRTVAQTQSTYQYIPAKATYAETQPQQVAPQTETRVVERERVYVEPSTTVIYRPAPVYVPSYSPIWDRPYYYPWNRTYYRYGCGPRNSSYYRSGWSVGFGFGF